MNRTVVVNNDDDDTSEGKIGDCSNCDVEEYTFQIDTPVWKDKEDEVDVLGSNWCWDQWK